MPNDTHGDDRHITLNAVQNAASAAGITPNEVVKNLSDSLKQEGGAKSSASAD